MPRSFQDTVETISWSAPDTHDQVALRELTAFIDHRIDEVGSSFVVNRERSDVVYIVVNLDRYRNISDRWAELLIHQYRLAGWDYVELQGRSRGSPQLSLGIATQPIIVELVDGTSCRVLAEPEESLHQTVQRIVQHGVKRPIEAA